MISFLRPSTRHPKNLCRIVGGQDPLLLRLVKIGPKRVMFLLSKSVHDGGYGHKLFGVDLLRVRKRFKVLGYVGYTLTRVCGQDGFGMLWTQYQSLQEQNQKFFGFMIEWTLKNSQKYKMYCWFFMYLAMACGMAAISGNLVAGFLARAFGEIRMVQLRQNHGRVQASMRLFCCCQRKIDCNVIRAVVKNLHVGMVIL